MFIWGRSGLELGCPLGPAGQVALHWGSVFCVLNIVSMVGRHAWTLRSTDTGGWADTCAGALLVHRENRVEVAQVHSLHCRRLCPEGAGHMLQVDETHHEELVFNNPPTLLLRTI